jgi:hypothetical protein
LKESVPTHRPTGQILAVRPGARDKQRETAGSASPAGAHRNSSSRHDPYCQPTGKSGCRGARVSTGAETTWKSGPECGVGSEPPIVLPPVGRWRRPRGGGRPTALSAAPCDGPAIRSVLAPLGPKRIAQGFLPPVIRLTAGGVILDHKALKKAHSRGGRRCRIGTCSIWRTAGAGVAPA